MEKHLGSSNGIIVESDEDGIKCSGKELYHHSSEYGKSACAISNNLSQSGIMSSTPTGITKTSLNSWRKPSTSTSCDDNTDEDESPIPVSRSRQPGVVDTESELSPEGRSPDRFGSWRPSQANKLARTHHDPKQLNYNILDVSAEGDSHRFLKSKKKRKPRILDSDEEHESDGHSEKRKDQNGSDDSVLVSSPEVGTSFSPKVQNVCEDSVCKVKKQERKNRPWVIDSDEEDELDGYTEKKKDQTGSDDSVNELLRQVGKSFLPQVQNVTKDCVVLSSPEVSNALSPQEKCGHKFRIKKKTQTSGDTSGQPHSFDTSSGSMAPVNQSCSVLEVSGSSAGNTSGRSLTSALSFTDMTAQEMQEKLRQKQVSVVILCNFQLQDQ